MQQMPLSASMSAPASMPYSPVSGSLATDAVKPAAVEPLPAVYTARGRKSTTYFRNCDLAVDGSPTWMTAKREGGDNIVMLGQAYACFVYVMMHCILHNK